MKQKSLAMWLKLVLAGMGLCGLIVYFVVVPEIGRSIVLDAPEFSGWYWPWQIFLWLTGIPCCAALVFGWRIAANIGKDRSFSNENARLLKWIAWLAAGDAAFLFLGNLVMLLMNMNHPGVVLASLLVVFAGAAVAVAAGCLSHLVGKAAALQEQSDLTI